MEDLVDVGMPGWPAALSIRRAICLRLRSSTGRFCFWGDSFIFWPYQDRPKFWDRIIILRNPYIGFLSHSGYSQWHCVAYDKAACS